LGALPYRRLGREINTTEVDKFQRVRFYPSFQPPKTTITHIVTFSGEILKPCYHENMTTLYHNTMMTHILT
jgi:hypothetical protein